MTPALTAWLFWLASLHHLLVVLCKQPAPILAPQAPVEIAGALNGQVSSERSLQQLHADQVDMSDALAAATDLVRSSLAASKSERVVSDLTAGTSGDFDDPYLSRQRFMRHRAVRLGRASSSGGSRAKRGARSSYIHHGAAAGRQQASGGDPDPMAALHGSSGSAGGGSSRGSRASAAAGESGREYDGDISSSSSSSSSGSDSLEALLGLLQDGRAGQLRYTGGQVLPSTKADDSVAGGSQVAYNAGAAMLRGARRPGAMEADALMAQVVEEEEQQQQQQQQGLSSGGEGGIGSGGGASSTSGSSAGGGPPLGALLREVMARRGPVQLDRRRAFPIERGLCGTWMSEYAALHADMLAGRVPARTAIMVSSESGLADRLSATVSVFLFALLTGRAFQYRWEGRHELWQSLRSDFIDWRYTAPEAGGGRVLNLSLYDRNWDVGSRRDKLAYLFWRTNLSALGEGYEHVVWTSNRGASYRALFNPWLQQRLRLMGLRPASAFACLFDFLFRPTAAVLDMFAPQLRVLQEPGIAKIGVQVRVGDAVLNEPQANEPFFEHYRPFFACAEELEEQLRPRGAPVVWFLLSDSKLIRHQAVEEFGDKVLVNLKVVVEHIQDRPLHRDMGLMAAAGELWLFSLADMHIITKGSGYGRVGAMLACSWQNVYSLDSPAMWFRSCRLNDAESLSSVTSDWTGI